MIVECIRKGDPGDSNKKFVPKKGKQYNVSRVINNRCSLDGTRNRTWYVIEDLGNYLQHSSLFKIVEIEDDRMQELLTMYHKELNGVKLLNKIFKV